MKKRILLLALSLLTALSMTSCRKKAYSNELVHNEYHDFTITDFHYYEDDDYYNSYLFDLENTGDEYLSLGSAFIMNDKKGEKHYLYPRQYLGNDNNELFYQEALGPKQKNKVLAWTYDRDVTIKSSDFIGINTKDNWSVTASSFDKHYIIEDYRFESQPSVSEMADDYNYGANYSYQFFMNRNIVPNAAEKTYNLLDIIYDDERYTINVSRRDMELFYFPTNGQLNLEKLQLERILFVKYIPNRQEVKKEKTFETLAIVLLGVIPSIMVISGITAGIIYLAKKNKKKECKVR